MRPIQEKIAASILRIIRARRKSASGQLNHRPSQFSGSLAPAALRDVVFSDFKAVAALKQRGGLAADSPENWQRLWQNNPALVHPGGRPMGWVLEAGGVIVGYMGNISLVCRFGDKRLTAVASHGLVVDPCYRAIGVSLVAAFFRQKSVDLFLSTSAIESVGKIALAFKSSSLPQPDYDNVLFWVLQPRSFADALMKKLTLNPLVAGVGGSLTSFAVATDNILRRRRPRRSSELLAIREISTREIGDDFESLWMEKLNEDPRLLADRTPVTLRWHYEIPGDLGSVRVLCCYQDGKLVGYVVVRTDTDGKSGLSKSIIADLIARRDDPKVVRALFVAAYDHAKSVRSHVLEVTGFPPNIRSVCLQWNPYRRKLPACPFYYKAADPLLHQTLSKATAWYACPFDGDETLIRPSYSSFPLIETSGAQAQGRTGGSVCIAREQETSEVF